MQQGQMVKVYARPMTDEGLEGAAELVTAAPPGRSAERGYECWMVRFIGAGPRRLVARLVHSRNLVEWD